MKTRVFQLITQLGQPEMIARNFRQRNILFHLENVRRKGLNLPFQFPRAVADLCPQPPFLLLVALGPRGFLLCMALRRRLGRTEEPPFRLWPVVVCAALFLVTRHLQSGYLQIPFLLRVTLPSGWYQSWLAPLGLPGPGFSSADYFPLLPWCFVFAAGTVVGRLAKAGKFPAWTYPSRVPFFSFLGRHALLIYIVHQPVIYGAALLVQALATRG